MLDHGRAVNGTAFLDKDTLVKVVSQQTFEVRGTVSTTNNSSPKESYQVAYVQVMSGEAKGQAGWVVMKGPNSGTTLVSAPKDFQASQATSATASANAQNSSDLTVSVSRGDSRMQVAGKEIFSVSVANVGGAPVKGSFSVSVEVDGKVIKTERVKGPIAAGGSHYFNVEVSESVIRRGGTLTVRVDSQNAIAESQKNNNSASVKL